MNNKKAALAARLAGGVDQKNARVIAAAWRGGAYVAGPA